MASMVTLRARPARCTSSVTTSSAVVSLVQSRKAIASREPAHTHQTDSPFLHNTIFRLLGIPYTYYRYECSDVNEILPITKQDDFGGSSVTMYVKQVRELLDLFIGLTYLSLGRTRSPF